MNRRTLYSSFCYGVIAAAIGGREAWQLTLVVVAGRRGVGYNAKATPSS